MIEKILNKIFSNLIKIFQLKFLLDSSPFKKKNTIVLCNIKSNNRLLYFLMETAKKEIIHKFKNFRNYWWTKTLSLAIEKLFFKSYSSVSYM